ncbi:MAG: cellulase family glycosylhydrolase [Spirochaetaceae bacterium]|nr:cellulase family glycosylhydrolase [Spirochaetaceae bacterium]
MDLIAWFEAWQPGNLPNLNKYDETDFAMLKSMGVEIIRLPIQFALLMEPANTGKVYDIVFERLDQICDWAEKYQIYLVIDNHSFSTQEEQKNPPNAKVHKEHLDAVWPQIAQRYKNRSEYIIYEILNEPVGRGDIPAKWYKIQQDTIDVIRKYDTKHTIVVTSANWSSIDTLVKMKPYKDPNLIYTFHSYEPFMFCQQGCDWGDWNDVKNVPFPYDKSRHSEIQYSKENTGAELAFSSEGDYQRQGNVKWVNQRIKQAGDWGKKNKVRIWAGEMGAAYWINPKDRLAWINAAVAAYKANNIPYCVWGIDGDTGFLNSGNGSYPDDIDQDALEAYGFKMPDESLVAKAKAVYDAFPQKPYIVYDGLAGKGTRETWRNGTKSAKDDDAHKYSEKILDLQNASLRIYLPTPIISKVAANRDNLVLSFSVKFTDAKQNFKLHLMDTDGEAELPPWRNTAYINASDYKVGEWVFVEIPLSHLKEDGAWSFKANKWFNPQGKFDWNRLDCVLFDFYHEKNDQKGEIYIDDVMFKLK